MEVGPHLGLFYLVLFSLKKVKDISTKVLVIHGENDQICKVNHGILILENCKNAVTPLWVPEAGHNDIDEWPIVWKRLQDFISDELVNCLTFSHNMSCRSCVIDTHFVWGCVEGGNKIRIVL